MLSAAELGANYLPKIDPKIHKERVKATSKRINMVVSALSDSRIKHFFIPPINSMVLESFGAESFSNKWSLETQIAVIDAMTKYGFNETNGYPSNDKGLFERVVEGEKGDSIEQILYPSETVPSLVFQRIRIGSAEGETLKVIWSALAQKNREN